MRESAASAKCRTARSPLSPPTCDSCQATNSFLSRYKTRPASEADKETSQTGIGPAERVFREFPGPTDQLDHIVTERFPQPRRSRPPRKPHTPSTPDHHGPPRFREPWRTPEDLQYHHCRARIEHPPAAVMTARCATADARQETSRSAGDGVGIGSRFRCRQDSSCPSQLSPPWIRDRRSSNVARSCEKAGGRLMENAAARRR